MSRKAAARLFTSSICPSCRAEILFRHSVPRTFSTVSPLKQAASEKPPPPRVGNAVEPVMSGLSKAFMARQQQQQQQQRHTAPNRFSDLSDLFEDATNAAAQAVAEATHKLPEHHHFHIYATKHNTHIALTRPNKGAIISLSTGNIGFRKAQRGTYDAAFQLAAYVMKSIQERGLLRAGPDDGVGENKIRQLEVVLRGFGPGRDAVTKALLGTEGRALRSRVVKISDGTRLKFGGTRSPNPRRLG